ncbi:uncharacterized protein N7469_005224 [Penicillium citrinum]|uniref:Uncharacterized protein n=2 Tax=Penicillium TaxID=5073 RepID=A0A9W9P3S9_PENCI|nr:uncharacterized protein N7469_005224 [Penicillium citrinum]KAJ5233458.1 hypothetical protein N7469_005224 [Penicillium citrinum]KAJ5573070.1 hypothetical protein N7450_010054 [Penicillium hetheringtonii]
MDIGFKTGYDNVSIQFLSARSQIPRSHVLNFLSVFLRLQFWAGNERQWTLLLALPEEKGWNVADRLLEVLAGGLSLVHATIHVIKEAEKEIARLQEHINLLKFVRQRDHEEREKEIAEFHAEKIKIQDEHSREIREMETTLNYDWLQKKAS